MARLTSGNVFKYRSMPPRTITTSFVLNPASPGTPASASVIWFNSAVARSQRIPPVQYLSIEDGEEGWVVAVVI